MTGRRPHLQEYVTEVGQNVGIPFVCTCSVRELNHETLKTVQHNTMQLPQDSHFQTKMSCLVWDCNPRSRQML